MVMNPELLDPLDDEPVEEFDVLLLVVPVEDDVPLDDPPTVPVIVSTFPACGALSTVPVSVLFA